MKTTMALFWSCITQLYGVKDMKSVNYNSNCSGAKPVLGIGPNPIPMGLARMGSPVDRGRGGPNGIGPTATLMVREEMYNLLSRGSVQRLTVHPTREGVGDISGVMLRAHEGHLLAGCHREVTNQGNYT